MQTITLLLPPMLKAYIGGFYILQPPVNLCVYHKPTVSFVVKAAQPLPQALEQKRHTPIHLISWVPLRPRTGMAGGAGNSWRELHGHPFTDPPLQVMNQEETCVTPLPGSETSLCRSAGRGGLCSTSFSEVHRRYHGSNTPDVSLGRTYHTTGPPCENNKIK